jgi:hypothetical protein
MLQSNNFPKINSLSARRNIPVCAFKHHLLSKI